MVVVVDTNLIPAPRTADSAPRRGRRVSAGVEGLQARRRCRAAQRRRWGRVVDRVAVPQLRQPLAAGALVLAIALTVLPWTGPGPWAGIAATGWMLAGVLVLRPAFLLIHAAIAGAAVWVATSSMFPAMPAVVLCLVVLDGMVLGYGTSRWNASAELEQGESMLGALRDRLHAQGVVPALEPGWQVETALRAANGDAFSGDFLVAGRAEGSPVVEIALVDVSGKGRGAGSRALLLSGALGGMLGEIAPDEFLGAANRYLLRQDWHEGFATAVHAQVDLVTGRFRVSGAGHPPAARFDAGAGRWEVFPDDQGPLLGVVPGAGFPGIDGVLNRGDALLLYTDGLVESPGRDVQLGIDRLLGQAERVMTRGFHGGAVAIMDGAAGGNSDDRAVVLIWRS